MLAAVTAALALCAQLLGAQVSITFDADSAVVDARYELARPLDTLQLSLVRLSRQVVEPARAQSLHNWVPRPARDGLLWLALPPGGPDGRSVTLRYVVRGTLERIPIAVPDVPAEPGGGRVQLAVRGLERDAALARGFPRLAPRGDGALSARLDNLPSLLRRPPARWGWSVSRLTEALVVLLLVAASVTWLVWRRAARAAPVA